MDRRFEVEDGSPVEMAKAVAEHMTEYFRDFVEKWPETLKVVEIDPTTKRIMRGGFRFELQRGFMKVGYTSGRVDSSQWYKPEWAYNERNPVNQPVQ
jgi:hypothetical protein